MAKIRDGSTYLDNHLCANDYYAEGEKITGQWQGQLAEQLELTGKAIEAGDTAFRMLRENVNPATGEKLTQRNVEGSVRFYDFQCGAEKSVSVLHALTGDDRLALAHDRAAARAFAELESFAACRVRDGAAAWSNDTRATGKVCAAVFRHDASRALDPQLHTHFVVANATWDAQKSRMVALESRQMVEAIRYAGKVYQNELAREVQSLGYEVAEKRGAKGMIEGFTVQGVSADVCERFSRRRAEVEAGIAEFQKVKGRVPSPAEIAVITRQTRNAKLSEISTPEVRAAQLARLSEDERRQLDTLKDAALRRGPVQEAAGDGSDGGGRETDALAAAAAHRFERASVLKGHEILAEALNVGLGRLRLDRLKAQAQAGAGGLVALGRAENTLSVEFATARGVSLEKWAVGLVNRTQGTCAALVAGNIPVAEWLADEQKRAVRFVVWSQDQFMAIRGVAGAGKTTLLKELDGHLQKASHRLLYLAPTAAAVKVLKSEGFTNATTVSDYLAKAGRGAMPAEWQKAVVVVDEAGLQSNKQGADVLGLAQRESQRVVFVGDSRQHSSVEAGDFLRVLEAHSKIAGCELKDIRRQTAADYNQAVRLLASGQAAAGMERLDGMGWIKEEASDYLHAAAAEYLRLSVAAKPKESVLCVAPTWAENHVLTRHVREGLRAAGQLGEARMVDVLESVGWTTQQRRVAANYQPGQMVTFNRDVKGEFKKGESLLVERIEAGQVMLAGGKALDLGKAALFDVAARREIELAAGDKILLRVNDKKAGLVNGDVLTVKSIAVNGRIETAEGKTLSASYRHFTHGYVVTSHKSQGRTADKVVVAAARLDCKAAYVACSRGRQSCAVFTPDKASLFAGLPRSADRRAVLDVLKEQEAIRAYLPSPAALGRAARPDLLAIAVEIPPDLADAPAGGHRSRGKSKGNIAELSR
jgi:conjugative relaxase-like TrwC/TraI family protein